MSGIASIAPLCGLVAILSICGGPLPGGTAAAADSTHLAAAARTPPPAPQVRSPIDFFRELLALSPVQQRAALAGRPGENQRQIMEKLREYSALSASERELKLRSTELRWYLMPLMQTPPTNRPAQLQLVPEDLRPLIEVRVAAWDQLPPEVRHDLLENEAALRQLSGTNHDSRAPAGDGPGAEMVYAAQRWHSMGDEQRQELLQRFEQFFGLTAREQRATLESISTTERRQIEATLKSFRQLTPAQRNASIRSLLQYADLPAEERRQFLENAERWKRMTPDQRKAWRDLVARLSQQPPLPPGTQPTPPAIPGPAQTQVTNGN